MLAAGTFLPETTWQEICYGARVIGATPLDELAAELADRAVALAQAARTAANDRPPPRLGVQDRRALRDRFIYDLLRSQAGDEADLFRQSEIMGMDLRRPRAVILLDRGAAAGVDDAEALIDRVVQFFHLPSDTICGYIGNGEVVILKASSTADLGPWANPNDRGAATGGASWANLPALKRAAGELADRLRADTRSPLEVGVGRYHPGLRGLGLSYRDARTALLVGHQYVPDRSVHALDELGVGAWVGVLDERTRMDLAARLIAPLDGCVDLLQTIEVFFAENSVSSAVATRLAIHRNTLAYRLERVRQLTGLDPHRLDDAIQLRLAMLIRQRPVPVHNT
jgi:carbohydrate diacid regulator